MKSLPEEAGAWPFPLRVDPTGRMSRNRRESRVHVSDPGDTPGRTQDAS